jgi:hypothetical protein
VPWGNEIPPSEIVVNKYVVVCDWMEWYTLICYFVYN